MVSEEHVKKGCEWGIAQFCHGKLWPAEKLSQGDWVIYYSPKVQMGEPEPCKSFTAIGQVVDSEPHQVEQFPGFKPYRRKIDYKNARKISIDSLKSKLNFIRENPNWGMLMRRGFFEISEADFGLISHEMLKL